MYSFTLKMEIVGLTVVLDFGFQIILKLIALDVTKKQRKFNGCHLKKYGYIAHIKYSAMRYTNTYGINLAKKLC
jgi:hypothetical protein